MIDYVYEVRFPENPDSTFTQKFSSKQEALDFSDEYPGSEVYMLELEYDDYTGLRGIGNLVSEVQIRGPEVDANLADENKANSCEGEECRMPEYEDTLDEAVPVIQTTLNGPKLPSSKIIGQQLELSDYDKSGNLKKSSVSDKALQDQIRNQDRYIHQVYNINNPEKSYVDVHESVEEDDMTDEELGEALFSAINTKPEVTEDAAGIIDDYDLKADEANCVWCGEKFPLNELQYKEGLGYICSNCHKAAEAHDINLDEE